MAGQKVHLRLGRRTYICSPKFAQYTRSTVARLSWHYIYIYEKAK